MNNNGRGGRAFANGEHRAAMEFLNKESPRGRRNSLVQAEAIHTAPMMDRMTPARAFTSAEFENMRDRNGRIDARHLIGMMHSSQEQAWDPNRGGGRRQIRTGRNFVVPDRDNAGQTFTVRIHTNDNTRNARDENAYSNAVIRVIRNHDNRALMGGRSHADQAGANAWILHPNDAQANAAHIPAINAGRLRGG